LEETVPNGDEPFLSYAIVCSSVFVYDLLNENFNLFFDFHDFFGDHRDFNNLLNFLNPVSVDHNLFFNLNLMNRFLHDWFLNDSLNFYEFLMDYRLLNNALNLLITNSIDRFFDLNHLYDFNRSLNNFFDFHYLNRFNRNFDLLVNIHNFLNLIWVWNIYIFWHFYDMLNHFLNFYNFFLDDMHISFDNLYLFYRDFNEFFHCLKLNTDYGNFNNFFDLNQLD
jgi:hypothetical protein